MFQLKDKDCQTVFLKKTNYILLVTHFDYEDAKIKMKKMGKSVPYKTNPKKAGAFHAQISETGRHQGKNPDER